MQATSYKKNILRSNKSTYVIYDSLLAVMMNNSKIKKKTRTS